MQGDGFFQPAALPSLCWEASSDGPVRLRNCSAGQPGNMVFATPAGNTGPICLTGRPNQCLHVTDVASATERIRMSDRTTMEVSARTTMARIHMSDRSIA